MNETHDKLKKTTINKKFELNSNISTLHIQYRNSSV